MDLMPVPRIVPAALVGLSLSLVLAACSSTPAEPSTQPRPATTQPSASSAGEAPATDPVAVATDLEVPWAIAFIPGGDALVTLRDKAEVIRVSASGEQTTLGKIDGVEADGEGGLLGVAVSPTFASDKTVHFYSTADDDNRVIRTTLGAQGFGDQTPVLTGIPKAGNHNGGRIAWGPDGYLYVGTGDAADPDRSQDRANLGGKILRITAEGKAAPGNPFGDSPVWSLGHRNVQGLAWGKDGTMFASEFGQNTWDELNVITAGKNYGWPVVEGIEDTKDDFVAPIAQWSPSDSSPSGIAVGADGAVYLSALRGESLWKIPVEGASRKGEPIRLLQGRFGRIRDAVAAPDKSLWILSNNTSRSEPREGDDRVIRVPLS